jgi:hypothetical protein
VLSPPQLRVAQPWPDAGFTPKDWPQGVRQQPSVVKTPLQASMPLSGDGHQNPVLIQVLLNRLWLPIDCGGGREEMGH